MELQEIEVIIEKDGQVSIQVRGVKGLSCLDLTKDLELILGGKIEAREINADSYDTSQADLATQQVKG
ncbi:MAG: hypothetical protein B6242_01240 [Anaerolineaceae bacterium 4572_78]|nr:MAG: hypothetical protein B6242_01240 [Anaerolineaceae bacterium 4572_78]